MDNQQSGLLEDNEAEADLLHENAQMRSDLDTQQEDDTEETQLLQRVAVKGPAVRGGMASWRSRTKIQAGGLLILLLISALGLVFWYTNRSVGVVTYRVGGMQMVSQDIGGGGVVFPRQQFDLSYPAAERVLNVMVKAGDHVALNQPLVRLDTSQIDLQVSQAANDVAAAQQYLNSISSSGNSVTIAQAQQALQTAQSRYNALISQESSPTFHDGVLVSPMSGVVTAVNIDSGEIFAPGTVLVTVMDLSSVVVHAKLPLENLIQVHVGLPAIVTPSAVSSLNESGTVTSVIPTADPQTDTFEVWIALPDQQTVLPGMSVFVRVQAPVLAYVVPRITVLNPDLESVVFVVRNGRAALNQVQVIGRSADLLYIQGDIHPGDLLVIRPLDTLHNAQPIHVQSVSR
jgi:RND family efflux transporter MFP subunit